MYTPTREASVVYETCFILPLASTEIVQKKGGVVPAGHPATQTNEYVADPHLFGIPHF